MHGSVYVEITLTMINKCFIKIVNVIILVHCVCAQGVIAHRKQALYVCLNPVLYSGLLEKEVHDTCTDKEIFAVRNHTHYDL